MKEAANRRHKLTRVLAVLLMVVSPAFARERPKKPQFKYAGGTAYIEAGCAGSLELASTELTFQCRGGSVTIPYASIRLMQYRPDVSRQVRKMKIRWKVKPPYASGSQNRFFTILYEEQGATRAVVLAVSPGTMRPYLAEIDLKAGKRVEVWRYED